MKDGKKVLGLVLGAMKENQSKDKPTHEGSEHDLAKHDSMHQFLKAVDKKDLNSMSESLSNFVYMCNEK